MFYFRLFKFVAVILKMKKMKKGSYKVKREQEGRKLCKNEADRSSFHFFPSALMSIK
jgi:hypothetical protein